MKCFVHGVEAKAKNKRVKVFVGEDKDGAFVLVKIKWLGFDPISGKRVPQTQGLRMSTQSFNMMLGAFQAACKTAPYRTSTGKRKKNVSEALGDFLRYRGAVA